MAAPTLPTDLPALRRAIEAGETFEYRFFWGHTPRDDGRLSDAVFSQWWPAPFAIDAVTYRTAEHWMMASKAALFGDGERWARILEAATAAEAKALGRQVQGFDGDRWRAAAPGIVTRGNVAKFDSDPALRAYLLATGRAILVEASPTDAIWGIGLAASDPAARDPRAWRGENQLGFALVAAREILRASG